MQVAASVSAVVGTGASVSMSASQASSGDGGGGGASGPGFFGMIQAVQFAAATSDMCGVQSQAVLVDILDVMQNLNVFNLRFPLPDLSEYLPATPELITTISFCGMSSEVDLVAQARGEVGDNFMANILVGSLILVSVCILHVLILVLMPRQWLPKIASSFPFVRIELVLFLVGNQGLLISSTQLIGLGLESNEQTCVAAGVVVLMIPTAFLLFVCVLLWIFVRPSSKSQKVVWSADDGWSIPERVLDATEENSAAEKGNRLVESLQSNFLDKFEFLLEGYHSERCAWVGAGLMLLTEYCLALAMGFGATSSCTAEQVPIAVRLSP